MRAANIIVPVEDPSLEGVTKALRMLKKLYLSRVSAEVKRHECYLKPGERRRLKAKRARKRARKQKSYWTNERLRYLDRNGLNDDSSRIAQGRGRITAAAGVAPRGMASAATEH